MKKITRIAQNYYGFKKAEEFLLNKIDGPTPQPQQLQPQPRPLANGCDYPLFKLEQVVPGVMRRRAVVRG